MELLENVTQYGLDAIAAVVHQNAHDKGFWDGGFTDEKFGTKLALIHSEVSELLEAFRKNQGEKAIVEEISDVIIRTLDLYAALRDNDIVGLSLDDVLQYKISKNIERPYLHGNRF